MTSPAPATGDDDVPAEDAPAARAAPDADPEAPETPGLPEPELLTLRDGLPTVVDTPEALVATCRALAAGTGPVAIDAERASGYRYSGRAYLVQLRREGSGTHLVDPIAFESLDPLPEVLAGVEWILHAATQDLPCLRGIDLHPDALFDTELAGRLLGYPRVGLATLVEEILGFRMKKEHSAADWSTRPLPESWLEYAALDVEVLVELRARLAEELEVAGKAEWARQEFEALLDFAPTPRPEAWRRTSGMHRVRGRRGLGAVRELWETRDRIARERDVSPSRILPDSAIVVAAGTMPNSRSALLGAKGFHGRGASRYARQWLDAVERAAGLDEDDLPARSPRGDGPPLPRAWAERDPVAARRLGLAREALLALAEDRSLPVENLLSPDTLRRVMWSPPAGRDPVTLLDDVVDALGALHARSWQVALTAPLLVTAIVAAERPAADGANGTNGVNGQSRAEPGDAAPEGEGGEAGEAGVDGGA